MINWNWFRETLMGTLRMEDATFEELRDAPDGMARGLQFMVALALFVGLVVGAASFFEGVSANPAQEVELAMDQVEEVFVQLEEAGIFGEEEEAGFVLDNIRAGMNMGLNIAGVVEETTPAPTPMVHLLQALGQALSKPFSWISLWLAWGVLTLLAARFLGGTATIQSMLATTSLVAAPHVLDAVGWVDCAGALVGALAWIWGFVVYVKATAIANRIGPGQAVLAVLLPLIILGVLVVGLIFFALAIAAIN